MNVDNDSSSITNQCTDKSTKKKLGLSKGVTKDILPNKGCELYISDNFSPAALVKISNINLEDIESDSSESSEKKPIVDPVPVKPITVTEEMNGKENCDKS